MAGIAVAPFADAIVVAAGASRRMGGMDKLTASLEGRSLLEWSVRAMAAAPTVRRILLVVAPDRVTSIGDESWMAGSGVKVVPGGPRRQDSAANGVMASDAEVVLVHDGARPFPSVDVIDTVAITAREHGAAVPVLPVVDSIKRMEDGVLAAVERDDLLRTQTPQGARRELLLDAYRALRDDQRAFSDEASLLAANRVEVVAVPGDPVNIKVTEPADMVLARALAAQRTPALRYGTAIDTHPFGAQDGLWLGGVDIPDAPRLHGHSDGDVVLHAIADALLGVAGLPDLGRQFPASDVETSGIPSRDLLGLAVDRVAAAGWQAASVDVTIVGARPHLGGARLDAMRAVIGSLLGLPVEQVGIKASTGNLSGPEGAGSVITATALVGLVRR